MAWTIADAVELARDLLQDQDTTYRHSDDKLVRYYNHALMEVNRIRPDLFLQASGAVTKYTSADIAALTVFPISSNYITPVAEYMAGLAELEDVEFAQDGRAVALMTMFRQSLSGG